MVTLDKSEFLRSFEVRPPRSFGIFLGAGSSTSAGIPGAEALIWEFKRKLYCDYHKIKEEKFRDLESEINRNILQKYFDDQGNLPKLFDSKEYSYYFERCYPKAIDRNYFIQQIVNKIEPSVGHRCLAELLNIGKIDHIWTTNFDELIERALSLQRSKQYKVITPDNSHQKDIADNYPKLIKLHGDYRYDRLQNLRTETRELDEKLRQYLADISNKQGLIVVGYNGRDNSIMDSLNEVLKNKSPFPLGLIWAIRKDSKPPQKVIDLVSNAAKVNGLSGFITIDSFDEFLYDLYLKSNVHNSEIETIAEKLYEKRLPFSLPQANQNIDILKLNAIKIVKFPKTIYSFTTNLSSWAELKKCTKDKNIISGFHKAKTFAFGQPENIKSAFNKKITSEIELVDVESKWLHFDDGFFLGFLYSIINQSLINEYGLKKINDDCSLKRYYLESQKIVDPKIPSYFNVYEAFEIQLQYIDSTLYFLILPTIEVIDKRVIKNDSPSSIYIYQKQQCINTIVSNRYNKNVDEKLKMWISYLEKKSKPIIFAIGEFRIELDHYYSFGGYRSQSKSNFFQCLSIYPEPNNVFSSTDKNYIMSHPLKGLKNFGPYDKTYGGNGGNGLIKLAVITPEKGYSKLLNHLNSLNKAVQNTTEKEYLIEYPGFHQIYKTILEFPLDTDDKLCVTINEAEASRGSMIQFYELMKKKVDYFNTIRGNFDLLLIYLPKYWEKFREQKNETTYF